MQKTKLFQGFIRERYNLSFREMNEAFVRKLVAVSEVSDEVIYKILLMNKNIESSNFVSENTLIEYHLVIDQFYKTCK